jgi:hypothetical protein
MAYSITAGRWVTVGAGRAAGERGEDDQRDDVGDQDPDRDHPLLEQGK